METVRIPNDATYSPISLTDLAIAAPIVSRVLLGATLPGFLLQTAAMAVYAGSSLQDWIERMGVRRIDFLNEFGADVNHLEAMSAELREAEMTVLAEKVNDGYVAERPALKELTVLVDRHLTDYIASITGQRVVTSTEVRTFSLVEFIFPFALGAADIFSGDVAIFQDTGVFQPHVVAHEFAHRKGYYREIDAQALAYLAMTASSENVLVQSALCERLHRHLRALTGDDEAAYDRKVENLSLRPELKEQFEQLRPSLDPLGKSVADVMRKLYDARMRITGQNGLSDYDVGFTNFLYTFETSKTAKQRPPQRGALR
jgi:hypothetical protein